MRAGGAQRKQEPQGAASPVNTGHLDEGRAEIARVDSTGQRPRKTKMAKPPGATSLYGNIFSPTGGRSLRLFAAHVFNSRLSSFGTNPYFRQ